MGLRHAAPLFVPFCALRASGPSVRRSWSAGMLENKAHEVRQLHDAGESVLLFHSIEVCLKKRACQEAFALMYRDAFESKLHPCL
eukprot:scaffold261485_cov18-Tisochrysis_lutea.AAC.1